MDEILNNRWEKINKNSKIYEEYCKQRDKLNDDMSAKLYSNSEECKRQKALKLVESQPEIDAIRQKFPEDLKDTDDQYDDYIHQLMSLYGNIDDLYDLYRDEIDKSIHKELAMKLKKLDLERNAQLHQDDAPHEYFAKRYQQLSVE